MADLRKANGHEAPWTIDYFGVGNENWGCGGNMRPEHYADEYRRYQTYVRNYHPDQPIFKICGGPNVDDTYWTEEVLKTCYENAPKSAHGFMDGLSMHYYVHPEGWEIKGSATEFDDKVWYKTLAKALYIETLIDHHSTIMDKYDPEKKIGLICDEWGTWFTCEPGTNPGFLYQQSTMRDALVAGLSLNIFNKHCDRVKMACIAQLVNVLQSVILTEGAKMLLTPTYYIFRMFKYHQDAELLESSVSENGLVGLEEKYQVPAISESVSVDKDGVYTITLANASLDQAEEMEVSFFEFAPKSAEAFIVKGNMRDYNTFEHGDVVKEEAYEDVKLTPNGVILNVPPCSVVSIRVK